MATRGFDDSNIAWNTLEGNPDVWYHILDIDDDPSVHDNVRADLEREGYLVYSATNGRDGHDHTHLKQPALIVLYLNLPDV